MTLTNSCIISPPTNYLILKGSFNLNFSLPQKHFKFENYLLPFELLHRDVYTSDSKHESLFHLKSKIKDAELSSNRVDNKKDHRYENLSQEQFDAFINLKHS